MREHEVPTHVQAEDKVLLWFTFPQIVAVVAVCAVAYSAYRYFPFGPSEFRLGLAILLGILGIAAVVGKVGGRGLPLVAADLLKFNLNRYQGGMCISGVLKTTERTTLNLTSPLDPSWVATGSAVWRYVHFTLALV